MTERRLSELQREYRNFFLGKLRLYGVKSPADLTKEKKSEFFTEIKQDWAKIKFAKKQEKENSAKKQAEEIRVIEKTPEQTRPEETPKEKVKSKPQEDKQEKETSKGFTKQINKSSEKVPQEPAKRNPSEEKPEIQKEFTKQIIKSEPNKEQTDDLKILRNYPLQYC